MFFDLSNLDPELLKKIMKWVIIPLTVVGALLAVGFFALTLFTMFSGQPLFHGASPGVNVMTPGLNTGSGGCCLPLCFPLPLFAFGSIPFLGKKRADQETEDHISEEVVVEE